MKGVRNLEESTLWSVGKAAHDLLEKQIAVCSVSPAFASDPKAIRNSPIVGPYSRTLPRVLWWS